MDPADPAKPDGPTDEAPPVPGRVLEADRPCLSCGYILKGLAPTGVCPECGTPIERSLRGNLLRYSSPEHLSLLHRGVVLIQTAIILSLLLVFGEIGVMALLTLLEMRTDEAEAVMTVAGLGAGVLSVWGWWWFSTPDPAVVGQETGVGARKLVRVAVVVANVAEIVGFAYDAAPSSNAAVADTLGLLSTIIHGAALLAAIVGFFAAMRYLVWLTPRLPNPRALARARKLMWLGPLLSILLCVIGWLIALILYYNLLDWVRKDLRAIRAEAGHS